MDILFVINKKDGQWTLLDFRELAVIDYAIEIPYEGAVIKITGKKL